MQRAADQPEYPERPFHAQVTRLDRLARSTRDLLNVLHEVAQSGAAFKSLHDAWADTSRALGVKVQDVLICDLKDCTYYVWVRIQHNGATVIRGSTDAFRQIWSESLSKAVEGA